MQGGSFKLTANDRGYGDRRLAGGELSNRANVQAGIKTY